VAIKDALENVKALEQLPALAVELGFEAAWLPANLGSATPIVIVGRRAGLLAGAIATDDAPRGARRIAAALGDRGVHAVVLALDPARRLLSVSVTGLGHPVATVALDRVRAIDERILARGRSAHDDSALAASLGWTEALAGQSLGQRFFAEFRRIVSAGRELLPRHAPPRDRHALVLLNLSRVLFLYFVQERGWLDHRPRFLREELDRCLAGSGGVETRLLRPLFFGTLNQPFARRSGATRRFGRIPFLNGGLFEPNPLEQRWRAALPDSFWREAFDEMFERYHFTVSEDDDRRMAIGPDMLGRVFEGIMDPDERSATGAFYTPSALVDRLVEEGLVRWLAARGGHDEGAARGELTAPTAASLELLRRVTVLDPAVGSGAFLMGALKRLVVARVAGGEARGRATRAVVSENLYGVDRNPNAVRLTELRLWLAVIQADDDGTPESVAPLPNLDAMVRQGDSVIEPVMLPFPVRPEHGAATAVSRRLVLTATGPEKRRAIEALRRVEVRSARAAVASAIATVEGQIRELLQAARSPGLFGHRRTLGRTEGIALGRLRGHRARLRALDRRLAATGEVPWFHYQSHFADVMARGGFDLVVGNPPWVRAESVSSYVRDGLKARYRWFRASGTRGFRHLPDLSVAFLERAFELVRPDGVVALVLPAKLLTAQYGAAARVGLAEGSEVHLLAELDERAAGFDATVYPLAMVASRRRPPPGHRIATDLGPHPGMAAQSTLGTAPWRPSPHRLAPLLAAAARHPVVADRFVCRLGVKTGADRTFLDPDADVEVGLLRPVLRGRDLEPFGAAPTSRIVWTHDRRGRPLDRLPPRAEAYLSRHQRKLLRRADYRSGPWWAVFRVEAAVANHRVVWADLSRRLAAVALVGPELEAAIPLNTCYLIATPNDRSAVTLAAWFNSRWIGALANGTATVAASGFRRFNAEVVGRLPLPDGVIEDAELYRLGREAQRTGRSDQDALDRRTAALLGIDPDPTPLSAFVTGS